jgi:hypothetical protein
MESADPLGLGAPMFALAFEPGRPSVVRLCLSVGRPDRLDPALADRLRSVLPGRNPELAMRSARSALTIEVVLLPTRDAARMFFG